VNYLSFIFIICLAVNTFQNSLPNKGDIIPMSPSFYGTYKITVKEIPSLEDVSSQVGPYPLINRPIYTFNCTPASIADLLDNLLANPFEDFSFYAFAEPAGGEYLASEPAEFSWLVVPGSPLYEEGEKMANVYCSQLSIYGVDEDGLTYSYNMKVWFDVERVVYAVSGTASWIEEGDLMTGSYTYLLKELNGEDLGKLGFE